jgi:hypothetical protein
MSFSPSPLLIGANSERTVARSHLLPRQRDVRFPKLGFWNVVLRDLWRESQSYVVKTPLILRCPYCGVQLVSTPWRRRGVCPAHKDLVEFDPQHTRNRELRK